MSTRLDRCAPTATNDGVEAALAPLGVQVLHPVAAGDPHAQRGDPVELAVEDVARHPVGRDAVAHHPAGLLARVPDLDLVAEPGQVVGGGQPARPGADDQHPLAGADRRAGRTTSPARARGRRGTARPSGSRPRCRGWPGCRRSRTGGSRPARGWPASGCRRPAAATPARDRPASACASQAWMFSPGRAAGIARRQQVDVDRPLAPGPARRGSARAADPAAASRPVALVRSAYPSRYSQPPSRSRDQGPGRVGPGSRAIRPRPRPPAPAPAPRPPARPPAPWSCGRHCDRMEP